jgi:hypothetical protein
MKSKSYTTTNVVKSVKSESLIKVHGDYIPLSDAISGNIPVSIEIGYVYGYVTWNNLLSAHVLTVTKGALKGQYLRVGAPITTPEKRAPLRLSMNNSLTQELLLMSALIDAL